MAELKAVAPSTDGSTFESASTASRDKDVSGCDSNSDRDRYFASVIPGITLSEDNGALTRDPGDPPDDVTREALMDAAFAAARDALRNQEVPVGCVFVRAGHLLAAGRNTVNATKNATRHAELNCVDAIYRRCAEARVPAAAVWAGVDVFVTVEPCIMCAAALIELGVRSVTFGCANQRFGGCGSVLDVPRKLMPSPVRFAQDATRVQQAVALLKDFYKGENPNAPKP